MKQFSRNIETLRLRKKLNKSEAAEVFGVTPTSYNRWEKGTECGFETLIKIARFFQVSIDDLLTKDLSEEHTHTHLLGAGPLLLEPGQEGYFSEQEMEAFKALERELQQQRDMMSKLMQEIGKMRQELVAQKSEIDALKRKH